MFLVGVRKSIRTAPFLKAKELYFRSTWKASVCIFEYISVRKFLFQWRRKLLSGGGLNNFLKTAHFLECFKVFHFTLNFWEIQLFISISILPFTELQRWNFPDNLDFKGKAMAKFVIRSHFVSIQSNVINKQKSNHGPMQKYVTCIITFFIHPIHQCLILSV